MFVIIKGSDEMALYFHAFKKINFMWLGIQVDVYRDRLTDVQLGIFCIAGAIATLIVGYLLVGLKGRICRPESKLLKAVFYYITIIMLVLDPIYLCLLDRCFGGGDLNGILYLMPQIYVWIIFCVILIFNLGLLVRKVTPTYAKAF